MYQALFFSPRGKEAKKQKKKKKEKKTPDLRLGEREPPVSLSLATVFFSRRNASQHLLRRLVKILKWRMCCLCCAIYKWLNILVFPDKEEKP